MRAIDASQWVEEVVNICECFCFLIEVEIEVIFTDSMFMSLKIHTLKP